MCWLHFYPSKTVWSWNIIACPHEMSWYLKVISSTRASITMNCCACRRHERMMIVTLTICKSAALLRTCYAMCITSVCIYLSKLGGGITSKISLRKDMCGGRVWELGQLRESHIQCDCWQQRSIICKCGCRLCFVAHDLSFVNDSVFMKQLFFH